MACQVALCGPRQHFKIIYNIYKIKIIKQFRPLDMPLAMILHLWPANQITIMGVALCHKNWMLRDDYQYSEPAFLFSRSDQDRLCCRVLLIRIYVGLFCF